jgi:phosphatidylserine/phosphatidylglycerophosphate/cardiolipin synthase-like enzyme
VSASEWVDRQATWQFLHNVEDHRKNLVIDRGRAALLTSHNLIDAAYDWHENLFWLSGDVAGQLWHTATAALGEALTLPQAISQAQRTELGLLAREPAVSQAKACMPSGSAVAGYPLAAPEPVSMLEDPSCTLVENDAIARALDALFAESGRGDTLLVASAYLSDLTRLEGLAQALERGAQVRVLVDSLRSLPLPAPHAWLTRNLCNQRVLVRARALRRAHPERFQVRVFDAHDGVMMHLKSTARLGPRPRLIAGQANYTPNSFTRAWLETDLASDHPQLVDAFAAHFHALWNDPASRPLRAGHARHVVGDTVRAGLLSLFAAAGLEP